MRWGGYLCWCLTAELEEFIAVDLTWEHLTSLSPRENLVLPNYKRWGNQITLKWKCSQPFGLFSQFLSRLIRLFAWFLSFMLKLLMNWLKIVYNTAGGSCFCLGIILIKREWRELWNGNDLRITFGSLARNWRLCFHNVILAAWATYWETKTCKYTDTKRKKERKETVSGDIVGSYNSVYNSSDI